MPSPSPQKRLARIWQKTNDEYPNLPHYRRAPRIPPTPITRLTANECYKGDNNTLWISTDGSAIKVNEKIQAGAGVRIRQNDQPTEAECKRVTGEQSVLQGELEAILYGLRRAPLNVDIILWIDSKSAIDTINGYRSARKQQQKLQLQKQLTAHKIVEEMKLRERTHNTVLLEWVPSHIKEKVTMRTNELQDEDEGIREIAKAKLKKISDWKDDINQRFPNRLEDIIKGNDIADESAKTGAKKALWADEIWGSTDHDVGQDIFYLVCAKDYIIEGQLRRHIRDELAARRDVEIAKVRNESKLQKEHYREEIWDAFLSATPTIQGFSVRKPAEEARAAANLGTHQQRMLDNRLPTAKNRRRVATWITNKENKQKILDKYPNDTCKGCGEGIDDATHVFMECQATKDKRTQIQLNIEKLLTGTRLKETRYVAGLESDQTKTDLTQNEHYKIMTGYILKEWKEALLETGKTSEQANQLLQTLSIDNITVSREIWIESRKIAHQTTDIPT